MTKGDRGGPHIADDVPKELRARKTQDILTPNHSASVLEVKFAAVELAGDARPIVGDGTGLHGKAKVGAFGAQRVEGILVVDHQNV